MNIAKRHAFFDAAAQEIIKDHPGAYFEIIVKQNPLGFRVLIEKQGIKRGFALPINVSAKDFSKQFVSEIEEIAKRIKRGPGNL